MVKCLPRTELQGKGELHSDTRNAINAQSSEREKGVLCGLTGYQSALTLCASALLL